ELEPRYQLSLTGLSAAGGESALVQVCVVDEAVARGGLGIRGAETRLRRCGVGGRRIVEIGPVEDVGHLHADVQPHAFLYPEFPPERQVLEGMTLAAVVAVIR